ncbi:FAD-binding and (Fe-S)-binding domain-containing protein [Streptomyces sp. NPDC088674]|uniref:FAD-binding and (Fe-S)-binding domain-containing protein n=1 Tax=Streptomyces sp. NPDC088674 TaxID=3365869 RepID=UPI00380F1EC6
MSPHPRPAPDTLAALHRALTRTVRGTVDFSPGARALTTMDASNYRRVPLGVVAPYDSDDVAATLAACREHGVPLVPRGGGTSIAGQATGTGIVLDFTRHMNRLLDLDPETRTARVQPGLVLDTLRAAAVPYGLTFGPDPSTHARCTLGGMIGNNSCGAHSVAWGTTADNTETLDVLAADGTPHRLARGWNTAAPAGHGRTPPGPARTPSGPAGTPPVPDALRALVDTHLALLRTGYPTLPRRISGYALDALLPEHGTDLARAWCGSEGTLGVLTEARVRLVEAPPARALAVLGYADESEAAEAAAGLLPFAPLTVEGMAADLVPDSASLPRGGAWLFAETGGADPAEAAHRARLLAGAAGALDARVVTDPAAQRALWRVREDAAGTATRGPDGAEAWPGWEDVAVPPARLGPYLREFRALLADHGLHGTPYGHFGEGCVHARIDFDLLSAPGIAVFRRFSEELAHLVVAHGGSLSGEHGDGQARAELLPVMYGPELTGLFAQVKAVWDPDDLLNPGILVRPAKLDENLRFAVLPREPVDVAFGYPQDGGDFSAAVRRCVGVAKCREPGGTHGTSVMCPSFRATGAEEHSTRGRARLLHEMLAGEVVTGGWRAPEVRDALDLCLSCKGCRSDCPVGVDMATYKAEFLHHHYAGRLRPASHYALGRLPAWLRAAAPLAHPLNAVARLRPLTSLALRLAGLTPERPLPALAARPLRVGEEGAPPPGTRPVLLWPDTFGRHLDPHIPRAARRVLADAGLHATTPPPWLNGAGVCCGLTYVSTGQLDAARRVMRRTLDAVDAVDAVGGVGADAGVGAGGGAGARGCEGTGAGGGPRAGTGAAPGEASASTPILVLEPSCAAALRTDLPELLPDDPRAARLAARVRTFAQVLEEEAAPGWEPPRIAASVVGQTHCHQHAVLGDAAERRLRARAGLSGELSGGCCGLAGNFGFERGHYATSVACAEDQLLPAVRAAEPEAVVLADGYSCRTQLSHLSPRTGRHLAEVLADALPARTP